MAEHKFAPGDKVRLVSDDVDATPMTVENYYLDIFDGQQAAKFIADIPEDWHHQVRCVWRNKKSEVQRETFHEAALVKI